LLKTLGIHLYEQLAGGARQSDLRETLDAAALFERSLLQLSQAEQACLRSIAESAPADWVEIIEIYGSDVLRSLQDRRLVIRSGDRINVFWDIFRDYLLTGKTPSIPFTYLPSSPSLDAFLRVATQLRHGQGCTLGELALTASLGEKTIGNVIRDLRMFGIATGEPSMPELDPTLPSGAARDVLEKVREVMRRHALTLNLAKLEPGTHITIADIATELQRLNATAGHRAETWRFYAERSALWLTATGFLVQSDREGWRRQDLGAIAALPRERRLRNRGVFTGDAPPAKVIEALEWLSTRPPLSHSAIHAAGHRNGVSVLSRYGIVKRGKDGLCRVVQNPGPEGWTGVVWDAVHDDACLRGLSDLVRRSPSLSRVQLAHWMAEKYGQEWSATSKKRIGTGLSRWVEWIIAGDHIHGVPPLPRARFANPSTLAEQVSLFADDE